MGAVSPCHVVGSVFTEGACQWYNVRARGVPWGAIYFKKNCVGISIIFRGVARQALI